MSQLLFINSPALPLHQSVIQIPGFIFPQLTQIKVQQLSDYSFIILVLLLILPIIQFSRLTDLLVFVVLYEFIISL